MTLRQATRSPFATRKWQVETFSASVMDTVDLTPSLTLFLGGRLDHFKYKLGTYDGATGAAVNFTGSTNNVAEYSDTLWNGHAGISLQDWPCDGLFHCRQRGRHQRRRIRYRHFLGLWRLVVFNGDAASAKPERSVNLELAPSSTCSTSGCC